jgi:class 3 adenylate cyclase
MRAILELSTDWEAMSENIAFVSLGFGGEEARRYAEFLRACVKPEAADRMWAAIAEVDVTDLLPRIQAPTLILQHQSSRIVSEQEVRQLAIGIPNARLVPLQGKQGDVDTLLSAIGEFLGDELPAAPPHPRPAAFRTVLFTDVEAHTEMLHRLGDEVGRSVLRDHERITRDALRMHGGTEIKTMGDGFMASFDSATRALQCAIDLQTAFASRNEGAAEPIRVRVGLTAGEPIAEDDDLFGATVTIASRIMACGSGGDILVSDVVRGLVAGKGFMFSDRGDVVLKGLEDPVRVYQVRWDSRDS